jgi:hypothetical protein
LLLGAYSCEGLRYPNYRNTGNFPPAPFLFENVEATRAAEAPANKRTGHESFVQSRAETDVREGNDSAGFRESLTEIFHATTVRRHDVEKDGTAVNENPRKVSVECSREWAFSAKLRKEVLNCIGS